MLLWFISQTIFYPSARILPRILPESFRKILPRNPSISAYSALKILPRNPSAKILPRRSANKKDVYFFGSFRSLPQNPSAEPFHKCLFCIENPSAGSFRKILPQKIDILSSFREDPSADPSEILPQNPSAEFFHKCLFRIENPSVESFRKDPSAKIGQQRNQLFSGILPQPSAKSFRGILPQMLILHWKSFRGILPQNPSAKNKLLLE